MAKQDSTNSDDLVIPATSDLFIATLFSAPKNEPILRDVINSTLENCGEPLIITAKVLNPINIKEFVHQKRIVLDVRVEDELHRFFNMEVQTVPHPAFEERIVFGWSDTFAKQLSAGNDYDELRTVFSIVITKFRMFRDADGFIHFVFEIRERRRPNMVLSDCMQIHFLQLYELQHDQLEVLESIESVSLRHWLIFFAFGGYIGENEMAQMVQDNPLVMQAQQELTHFSADPEMQELERRHRLWKLEYNSGLHAARKEGREEGEVSREAKNVVRLLQRSCGDVPEALAQKIYAISNMELLDRLFDLAYGCSSLEEFEKNIP